MNLKGKKVVFLGDSISEGLGVAHWQNCYHQRIKGHAELQWAHVDAIAGSRIAHRSLASQNPRKDLTMCGRAYNLPKDADLVVVYGGVNDYSHGHAPIGTPEDTTCDTFYGAVSHLMQYLKNTYPKVVFMTPARGNWRYGYNYMQPSVHPEKRGLGPMLPLIEYVNVIVSLGERHGIPVLNLYERLPIDPTIPEHHAKYTADGVHFNDDGHAVLADILLAFLQSLDD